MESGNESMDGESHPLILDLSPESEFDRLGLTPFLMIEVFEPSLSLKPSIPSFFNPSLSERFALPLLEQTTHFCQTAGLTSET